jgi:hypothetical protein
LKLNTKEDGRTLEIRPRHSDVDGWVARIRDAFGTTSLDFANSELSKLANALTPRGGEVSEQTENAILAVIDGARPCNEIEAMLVGQMAVTHAFALDLMGRARRVEEIQQFDSVGNMMVKLLRTFVMQAEALAKLRRGGEQKNMFTFIQAAKRLSATSPPSPGVGEERKMVDKPMQRTTREPLPLRQARRCGARTRSGKPCQSPAVNGKKRCRMHGGAKGSGAPSGERNGNYRHGRFTAEAIREHRTLREWIKEGCNRRRVSGVSTDPLV